MKKIKIWYLLLTALIYYPILLNNRIITYIAVYLLPLIFFILHYQWVLEIISRIGRTRIIYSVVAWGVIACASIVVPIIMGTNDFSYFANVPMDIVKFTFRSLFLLCVFELYVSKEKDVELFMRYFIYSCCLYILGTVVFILLPSFKEIWMKIIYIPDLDRSHIAKTFYLTRFGWSGFAGFSVTLWCCLCVIFNIYLIMTKYERKERYLQEFIPLILLLCGNMFYGRIGFLMSLGCIGIMLLYFLSRKPYYLVMALVAVTVVIVLILFLKEHNESVKTWYDWSFSLITNFINSGRIGTDSTDILFERMLFIPEFTTIILGDGIFTMPDETYYMRTDSGIMRPMLFYGIFFMLIGFFILFNMIMSLRNKGEMKKEVPVLLMMVNLFIVWIVFEIKGPIFYIMATYLLPFAILIIEKNKKEIRA